MFNAAVPLIILPRTSAIANEQWTAFEPGPPSMLAQKPTAISLAPLRTMAPHRCFTVKAGIPGCTFWKALSGQSAKKLRTELLDAALLLSAWIRGHVIEWGRMVWE